MLFHVHSFHLFSSTDASPCSEINELRREIKGIRLAQRQKEMFGKTAKKKDDEVVDLSWPSEAVREIEMQRDEIARLRAHIEDLECTSCSAGLCLSLSFCLRPSLWLCVSLSLFLLVCFV